MLRSQILRKKKAAAMRMNLNEFVGPREGEGDDANGDQSSSPRGHSAWHQQVHTA